MGNRLRGNRLQLIENPEATAHRAKRQATEHRTGFRHPSRRADKPAGKLGHPIDRRESEQ